MVSRWSVRAGGSPRVDLIPVTSMSSVGAIDDHGPQADTVPPLWSGADRAYWQGLGKGRSAATGKVCVVPHTA